MRELTYISARPVIFERSWWSEEVPEEGRKANGTPIFMKDEQGDLMTMPGGNGNKLKSMKFHLNTGKYRASGQTVEQVTQKQCEVSIRGDNRNPTGVFLGILLCLTLLEQGVWARWLQRSVCWIKAGTSGFCVYNRMQGNSSEHEILQSVNPNLSI